MPTVNTTVTLLEGMSFAGETTSGHRMVLDAADQLGGTNAGPQPMELVLLALGGCTGMDVISILRKMRQEVTGYEIRLSGVRTDEHPQVYQGITVEHVVTGHNLTEESVRRAIELSATKYCPISAMLGKAAAVRHTHRIVLE